MKKLMKSTQTARFKDIRSIVYGCCSPFNEPYVYIPHEHRNDTILKITKHEEPKNYDFQLNVSGLIFAFFYLPEKESVFECIHNYIHDFFGNAVEYYWAEGDSRNDIEVLPQLKNISFCIKMSLYEYNVNPESLEDTFSSYPVLKAIEIFTLEETETFSPISKFYQAKSIETYQHKYNIPDILGYFQGRQAIIRCRLDNMLVLDLIKFVNRWKSGEAFQKLEYFRIYVRRSETLPNQIMNEVGTKHIESTRIPPTHTLAKVYSWLGDDPNTDPITSRAYVVRKSDNRVASIIIQENTLSFGVWNKTEEEFSRMID